MFLTPFKPALEDMGEPVEDLMNQPPVEDVEAAPYVEEEPMVEDMPDENMITVDDGLPPDEDVMDELDEEVQGSESLLMEIEHLQNLAVAIETYGISPGMMFVADREGLLASTFIGKIPATESMIGPYRPESVTSQVALEGVMDAIKVKTAEWAAKAGGMVKSLVSKAGGMIKKAVDWAGSFAKSAATKTWDAAKAASATIKAHPYKTVAAVLAAIAAVAAVLALIWAFPTQASQVEAWRKRVVSAVTNIKMPGGKFVIKTSGADVIKWVKNTVDSMSTSTANAMGWTRNAAVSAAKSLADNVNKVSLLVADKITEARVKTIYDLSGVEYGLNDARASDAVRKLPGGVGFDFMEKHAQFKAMYDAKSIAMAKVLYRQKLLRFAVATTWLLLSTVVIGGFFLIKKTVSKVVSAVSSDTKKKPATA